MEVGGRPLGWSHEGDLLFVSEFGSDRVWVKPLPFWDIVSNLRVQGANTIHPFAITGDNTLLATGDGTEGLEIWDLKTKQRLGPVPFVQLRDFAFSIDGRRLVARDHQGLVHLYAVNRDEIEHPLVRLWGPPSKIVETDFHFWPTFVKEGRGLLVATAREARWIDVKTGSSVRAVPVRVSCRKASDGRYLAYGGLEESGLVDLSSGE